MLVMLSGIIILIKLLQPSNAILPIFITLLEIVMFIRLLQPPNAPSSMLVTLFGIIYCVSLLLIAYRINIDLALLNKIPSSELYC